MGYIILFIVVLIIISIFKSHPIVPITIISIIILIIGLIIFFEKKKQKELEKENQRKREMQELEIQRMREEKEREEEKRKKDFEARCMDIEEYNKRKREEEIKAYEEKNKQEYEAIRLKIEENKRKREEEIKIQCDKFNRILSELKLVKIELSENEHGRNYSKNFIPKNLTKATPLKKIKDFIAVDTETTGIRVSGNDIIQLSAVKFIDFQPSELWTTYIKPRKHIPEEATRVNGITDEMVENAPEFYQIIDSFNSFIGDLPLVAHNAPFDMKHLYVNGLDSIENKVVYDTLALSKSVVKEADSYKLQNICNYIGIYFDNAHNASSDCLATGLLFVNLLTRKHELITIKELLDYMDNQIKRK